MKRNKLLLVLCQFSKTVTLRFSKCISVSGFDQLNLTFFLNKSKLDKVGPFILMIACVATSITTTAQEKKWLVGDGFLYTDNTTTIGINTSTPQHTFDVNGEVNAQEILVNGTNVNKYWTQNTETLSLLSSGNVGIGTTTPSEKLTVAGIIHVEELKVDQTVPGPDYVFESSYELPTLKWLEEYIKEHHHLPYFKRAEEMETEGIDLEETQMALLRTLEETALHQIELQKRMEKLRAENEELEKQLRELQGD